MAQKKRTRKVSNFFAKCTKISNRMKDVPGKRMQLKIIRDTYPAGPIYRDWHRKKIYYCSECGGQVQWIGQKSCPHCHAKWKAEPQEEMRRENEYYLVLEAKGDIQVNRIYRVERYLHYGDPAQFRIYECERIFYSPKGNRLVYAKNVYPFTMYYDTFCPSSSIHIKRDSITWSTTARYNLPVYKFYIKSLTRQWQYKDIKGVLKATNNSTSALRMVALPYGETLYKTGQIEMLKYYAGRYENCPKKLERPINICNRNKYIIKDADLWIDTVSMMEDLGMDTHNPKFLCPTNLQEFHNQVLRRRQAKYERERVVRQQEIWKQRMQTDKKFAYMVTHWKEHFGKVLSLNLTANNLTIRPLQSIDEFREEGKAMHHCVNAREYWNYNRHPNSLILSAKDDEGHRLATIEYDKAAEKIVQCRAACNAVPERDTEIRNLINSNKATFDKLLKAA